MKKIAFTYKGKIVNFNDRYNEIMMNQVYYNHR